MKDIEITVTQATPWSRVLDAARWTVSKGGIYKEPTDKFKRGILMAEHSPIRLLEFDIKIKGIPYRNAVHFVRHHIGLEKFQCTLRDDRNAVVDDSKALPQGYPVNLWMSCNSQALINISRKRLCSLAEKTTRDVWTEVVAKLKEVCPEVAAVCVRECVYRGFCPEMKSCHYCDKPKYAEEVKSYRNTIANGQESKTK